MQPESEARKNIIDLRLRDAGWLVSDRTQVIEEFPLSFASSMFAPSDAASAAAEESHALHEDQAPYGSYGFSDYVLLAKNGKPLAIVEAKHIFLPVF